MKRNELQNEGTKSKLERKYRIEEKGIVVVHEEVQQRLVVIGSKLERYDNRTEPYRQNRLSESNQKKFFDELDGVEGKRWCLMQRKVLTFGVTYGINQ